MPRRRLITCAAAGAALLLAGCSESGVPSDDQAETADEGAAPEEGPAGTEPDATGTFDDPSGERLGTVELRESDAGTEVTVALSGLEPGFRGLHVHGIGECEPDSAHPEDPENTGDFMSAGGHLNPDDADHGEHAGDLSPLLVTDDGEATITLVTDRFTVEDLRDDDGAAFMVHSDADNFAHIPERYGEPDEDTLGTGDAGDRVACAVVE